MQILEPNGLAPQTLGTVVTVGNFDGVHIGHRHLIDEVVSRAHNLGLASALVTFEPHPRSVLNGGQPFEQLTTFMEKVHLINAAEVDYLIKIPFTTEFSRQSAEMFVESILVRLLNARAWVMGSNHKIGNSRTGENNFLHNVLSKYHIIPFTTDLLSCGDTIISSTRIRENIVTGLIADAVKMLGHPYLIEAQCVPGLKVGSRLGFPTLNFTRPFSQKVLPPVGVYAAELEYKGVLHNGALYFGDCPTFTDRIVHFEFHSLGESRVFPQVGETAKLWVHRFIRRDCRFSTTAELTLQIDRDINNIRNFFVEEKGHAINQGT